MRKFDWGMMVDDRGRRIAVLLRAGRSNESLKKKRESVIARPHVFRHRALYCHQRQVIMSDLNNTWGREGQEAMRATE
jgi:hypothetical protein